MKNKVIGILIGMFIMGVMVGCGQAIQSVQADENGYLKYCGKQGDIPGDTFSSILIYEDTVHGKVIYAGKRAGEAMTISAVDMNRGKEN